MAKQIVRPTIGYTTTAIIGILTHCIMCLAALAVFCSIDLVQSHTVWKHPKSKKEVITVRAILSDSMMDCGMWVQAQESWEIIMQLAKGEGDRASLELAMYKCGCIALRVSADLPTGRHFSIGTPIGGRRTDRILKPDRYMESRVHTAGLSRRRSWCSFATGCCLSSSSALRLCVRFIQSLIRRPRR